MGLVHRAWFEAQTAHFQTYSCGPTQEVSKLAARLEQFNQTYALLAGASAVASPPIIVLAFPDHHSLEPFLPLYQGRPASLAAFFARGSDENLIVLSLSPGGADSLDTVFHEYTHLLLRHNQAFWPLWLQEGMADIYSTFQVTGNHSVRIGSPPKFYAQLLSERPLLPLAELFRVKHDSPEYNERDRQGMFYAESWLLTHYLMLGGNPFYKARFGQLTVFLREGQPPEAAFTNAFRTPLPIMENRLRDYIAGGRFSPLSLTVAGDLYAPRSLSMRRLAPVETCFHLGDELLRLGRRKEAKGYFQGAQKLDPKSPLPYEGLGLLAAEEGKHEAALQSLRKAIECAPVGFLAHFAYAREVFEKGSRDSDSYKALGPADASEMRSELEKSLAMMPNFGPAQHLLGVFELIQGQDPAEAEQHLEKAVQLEPERLSYLLALAQAQLLQRNFPAARRTLGLLRLPYVEPELRAHAGEMLKLLPRHDPEAHK